MYRKQGGCTDSMVAACVMEKYWDIRNCKRSNDAPLLKKKKENGVVSVSSCVLQLSTICVKKQDKTPAISTDTNKSLLIVENWAKYVVGVSRWQLWPMQIFDNSTSRSSSPGWKAPVVLRPMSAGFLRPPSPLRRPPEPLEDMELEELGSLGLLTVGNCGRL